MEPAFGPAGHEPCPDIGQADAGFRDPVCFTAAAIVFHKNPDAFLCLVYRDPAKTFSAAGFYAVEDGIFHHGLDQQFGDHDVSQAGIGDDFISKPFTETQFLQCTVIFNEGKLLAERNQGRRLQDIAEHPRQLIEGVFQGVPVSDLVQSDKIVQGIEQKMGMELGLQRTEFNVLLPDSHDIFGLDPLFQLGCHMI